MDTAGLRESADVVERLGVERTYNKLNRAGLVLMVAGPDEFPDQAWMDLLRLAGDQSKVLVVLNKADLSQEQGNRLVWLRNFPDLVEISAQTGQGLDVLRGRMRDLVNLGRLTGDSVAVNARQRHSLDQAASALDRIQEGLQQNLGTELLAEEMRALLRSLAELTGDIAADDLLDAIFSKFCIGK
jgi:tRNA modification GTPase